MLLGNSHTLTNGLRVRLRLARGTDHAALLDLAARAGSPCGELELQRHVRVRPRSRIAVCACVWTEGREVLAGFAAGELLTGDPDVLLVDDDLAPEVAELLCAAVAEHGAAHRRPAA